MTFVRRNLQLFILGYVNFVGGTKIMNRMKGQFLIVVYLISYASYAQEAQGGLQEAIAQKSYTFIAEFMMPLKATSRDLDPGYGFKISGDTLTSNLPYMGRAYMADIGSTAGPLDFTSYEFDYSIKPRKKGGWSVQIRMRDTKGEQRFSLSVRENGLAMLSVSSVDRESISYNGRVEVK